MRPAKRESWYFAIGANSAQRGSTDSTKRTVVPPLADGVSQNSLVIERTTPWRIWRWMRKCWCSVNSNGRSTYSSGKPADTVRTT
jgi:hypothetical protein